MIPARHEWDDGGVCIHCGHNGCEEHHQLIGYTSCPVWDEAVRKRNFTNWINEVDPFAGPDVDPDQWLAYWSDARA